MANKIRTETPGKKPDNELKDLKSRVEKLEEKLDRLAAQFGVD